MKRFYVLLNRAAYLFVFWLALILGCLLHPQLEQDFRENLYGSFLFLILQLPFYCLILFGCYALMSIGWGLLTLGRHSVLSSFS